VRAVLDPNVLISAVLSPEGAPARILLAWVRGDFELVASQQLLNELERALAYPKLRKHIEPDEAGEFIEWLRSQAQLVDDPIGVGPIRSPDPGDDYLIALAASEGALLVSGDSDLLGLAEHIPVRSPSEFIEMFEEGSGRNVREGL
jgi:putative PIN family toxin of toxin-antitoxin system